ncbi:MAG: cyclic nucleotide-binding domain-containing protein [Gallionellaceae bacterium]
MESDNLILMTLRNTTLTEELRDFEVEQLANTIELREFKAGEQIISAQNPELKCALLILCSGEIEANTKAEGEKVTRTIKEPGDLANIIGFVGGNVMEVTATTVAKEDTLLLVMERVRFESLINTNPAIVYYVMRGITRYVHGIVRSINTQSVEMSNYIHKTGGRY